MLKLCLSLFRINIRLSGRHKCHLVRLPWYQVSLPKKCLLFRFADIHLTTDGDDGVGIEAAVGPHRELSSGSSVAYRPTVSRRKCPAPRAVMARLREGRAINTSPVPAATASSG